MDKGTKKRGFAFIEVLFIIAIGVFLLVILMPVLNTAKQRSVKTKCISNLRQIGMAMQLYAQDNNELLPPYMNTKQGADQSHWNDPTSLYWAIVSKANCIGIFYCPNDEYAGDDIEVFGVNHKYSSYYYNLTPPNSSSGILKISGLFQGGKLSVEPDEYEFIRDSNIGESALINGKRARGCDHLGGYNALYLDLHAVWSPKANK